MNPEEQKLDESIANILLKKMDAVGRGGAHG